MKRSERLLDAIGQIDDALILEAGRAGAKGGRKKGRKRPGRAVALRYRNALAACAVLAICLGVYGLTAGNGLSAFYGLRTGSSTAEESPEEASDSAAGQAVVTEALEEGAEAADGQAGAEAADAGEQNGSGAQENLSAEGVSDAGGIQAEKGNEASGEGAQEQEKQGRLSDRSQAQQTSEDEGQTAAQTELTQEAAGQERGNQGALPEPAAVKASVVESAQGRSGAEGSSAEGSSAEGSSAGSIALLLENQEEQGVLRCGALYFLEALQDGEWVEVPYLTEACWTEAMYTAEPGETVLLPLDLEALYGALPAGRYRIGKPCQLVLEGHAAADFTVYAQFELSE